MDLTPVPPPEPVRPADKPAIPLAPLGPAAEPFPPVPLRVLDEYDLRSPRRRRLLPLALFAATCFFTYAAGAYHWKPTFFGMPADGSEQWNLPQTWQLLAENWRDGLIYMVCVMGVLLAHEMGHFLMTVRYQIPASYPIFLPMPMMLTGTMGAVIGMEGFRANRRQLFDIGLAGPWAGLVLTVPLVWIGIKIAHPVVAQPGEIIFGDPLFAKLLINWLRPDIAAAGSGLAIRNPIYMAGWVGMFVTGLNMLPVSQLDGGHVIYALFLRRSIRIARMFLIFAIAFILVTGQLGWTLMVIIITLIGVDHPPTADDTVPLGKTRAILGTLSLVIPLFCFTPFRVAVA